MTSRNGTIINWNGDGKPSSIGSIAFTYDGVGERLKKVSGTDVTRYVGGDYEIAPNGTITKYLLGGKQVGTEFFVHQRDQLGSIQSVTDSTGTVVRRQKHEAFGNQHDAWGTHSESKGWIGEREEETELVYLNARYYDPEIGRFISPDPIVLPGQLLNRYTYSRNNPILFSDPSGLVASCGILCDASAGGGGGGSVISFFDFSNCHGMAFARGDCSPGLQPYASDLHGHDPTVDAILAEEEARHDAIVEETLAEAFIAGAVAESVEAFRESLQVQNPTDDGDYTINLELLGRTVQLTLDGTIPLDSAAANAAQFSAAFGFINLHRGRLMPRDFAILARLPQIHVVDSPDYNVSYWPIMNEMQITTEALSRDFMSFMNLAGSVAHEAYHAWSFGTGQRAHISAALEQVLASSYALEFVSRLGADANTVDTKHSILLLSFRDYMTDYFIP